MKSWVLLFVCITCVMGVCNDEDKTRNTFISYSLDGGKCSGLYRIEANSDATYVEATAFLTPASGTAPEVLFLTYYDYLYQREVQFILPVIENQPFEEFYGSDYGMGIIHKTDSCSLVSGHELTFSFVSFTIKNLKRGNGLFPFRTVEEIEIHFEGNMSSTTEVNDMNDPRQYTVNGDLYYREQL